MNTHSTSADGFVAVQWGDKSHFHTIGTRIPECHSNKSELDQFWAKLAATFEESKDVTDITMILDTDGSLTVWFNVEVTSGPTFAVVNNCVRRFKQSLRRWGFVLNPLTCHLRNPRKMLPH